MNQLKNLGITIGEKSLVEQTDFSIHTTTQQTHLQPIRKGLGTSASDRLNDQLNKGVALAMGKMEWKEPQLKRDSPHAPEERDGWEKKQIANRMKADKRFKERTKDDYEGTLRNTHGEDWHDDNDKQVEEMVSSAHEVDREFDGESRPVRRNPREWQRTGDGEKNYSYEVEEKSLSREELFLKATSSDGSDESPVKKGHPFPKVGSKKAPHLEKDPEQTREERAEKKRLMGKGCGVKKGAFKEMDIENALDSLVEMVSDPYADKAEELANLHENSEGIIERRVEKSAPMKRSLNNPFLKAVGPGGMVFDFGYRTGNAIADRASDLLNQHGDPVQSSNANYQRNSYQEAITEYAVKGEQNFEGKMFGNIDKGWDEQLGKSTDQQVKEAYEKGLLDNTGPAVINKHNETQIQMGGEVIKATSETDAALIKMMLEEQAAQRPNEGGVTVDASFGGAQTVAIDTSGNVLE
jgi:hypothetical protein